MMDAVIYKGKHWPTKKQSHVTEITLRRSKYGDMFKGFCPLCARDKKTNRGILITFKAPGVL